MALQRPSSEEDVANLALGKCHDEEIATFDDGVNRARVARRHFGLVRDALLARLDWNFAAAWDVPAADTADGIGVLVNRFPLPADCVAVRAVYEGEASDDTRLGDDEWAVESGRVTLAGVEVEAKVLVCDIDNPTVKYTRRVESPRLWDPLFMNAFVCLYAGAMAPELGRSDSEAKGYLAEAETLLVPLAKGADSREKASSKVGGRRLTSWLAARGGRQPWPGKMS